MKRTKFNIDSNLFIRAVKQINNYQWTFETIYDEDYQSLYSKINKNHPATMEIEYIKIYILQEFYHLDEYNAKLTLLQMEMSKIAKSAHQTYYKILKMEALLADYGIDNFKSQNLFGLLDIGQIRDLYVILKRMFEDKKSMFVAIEPYKEEYIDKNQH